MCEFWARYTLDKIFDDKAGWEVQNLLTVAAIVTEAARWRTETRGTHHRSDFPEPDELLRVHDVRRRGDGEPETVAVGGAATVPGTEAT